MGGGREGLDARSVHDTTSALSSLSPSLLSSSGLSFPPLCPCSVRPSIPGPLSLQCQLTEDPAAGFCFLEEPGHRALVPTELWDVRQMFGDRRHSASIAHLVLVPLTLTLSYTGGRSSFPDSGQPAGLLCCWRVGTQRASLTQQHPQGLGPFSETGHDLRPFSPLAAKQKAL